MVHQMMNNKINRAAKASRKRSSMLVNPSIFRRLTGLSILALLVSCGSPPKAPTSPDPAIPVPDIGADALPADEAVSAAWARMLAWDERLPLPSAATRPSAVWRPVHWVQLPGVQRDAIEALLPSWLRTCERAPAPLAPWCSQVRLLSMQPASTRVQWLVKEWQPYALETLDGSSKGLLTGYFEPQLRASRLPDAQHTVPLHGLPAGWRQGEVWYSRRDMDTLPAAQDALSGRELVWLQDPIDALIVQIQGSGRVLVTEPDGQVRAIRLAFAGHNGQTYGSVGRWLLDRGAVSNAHWSDIRAWAKANPGQVQQMLWSNPRVVFFREEPLNGMDAMAGPKGAQGVPLTPLRSIAVDRDSIPYGTPVWMATPGPTVNTQRWVMAQDTGGAIKGAVRADYFTGWGDEARDVASSLKQPLELWALWPRRLAPPR